MQSICQWGLCSQTSLNMLQISIKRTGYWHLEREVLAVDEGEKFEFVEQVLVHVLAEVGVAETTVPVVNDVPTVHDFSENVDQILEGHFGALVALHVFIEHQI